MANIFIDCGGHDGCSAIKFLLERPTFRVYTFEPNRKLEKFYRWIPTKLISAAVWIENSETEMILDDIDADGSTLMPSKQVDFSGKVPNSEMTHETVKTVDLSQFINELTTEEDYVILKLDIEGAEYKVLEHLLTTGVLSRLDELHCEFHWHKMGMTKEIHDDLIARLPVCFIPTEWDAGKFSIRKTGKKGRLKHLVTLWTRVTWARASSLLSKTPSTDGALPQKKQ